MEKEMESEQAQDKVKVIAGFLASAIDMEDEMSGSVYGEFLNRESWPALMDEEAFKNVRELLNILIQETEQHKQVFSALLNKLKSDAS